MGTELFGGIALFVVSFFIIVVLMYHILIKLLSETVKAGMLVRILMVLWLVFSYVSVLFIPLVRFVPTIGTGTEFVIVTALLIVGCIIILATFFTKPKGV